MRTQKPKGYWTDQMLVEAASKFKMRAACQRGDRSETMNLTVTRQAANPADHSIKCEGLRGATHLVLRASGFVTVAASGEHKAVCRATLGPPQALDDYERWHQVNAAQVVGLLYQITLTTGD